MSGDPREYYRSSRSDGRELPPLREIVGDALDKAPRSPYRFDFEEVNRALPGSTNQHSRYSSYGGYPPQRGPTLPPIRQVTSRSHSSRSTESPTAHAPHPRDRGYEPTSDPAIRRHAGLTNPQPATGPAPYSFNVLRAQQGDLVHVRTPSTRAQGILRPTAIIEDEDESHKRYKCEWPGCEKRYDRPSSLEVHRNTHTGSQPYPCTFPGCPRAFNVKSNMLRHFRSHPQQKGDMDVDDSSDDEEGGSNKWPAEDPSSSRYFHTPSSSSQHSSSSQYPSSSQRPSSSNLANTSTRSHTPSSQYYSSSRR